mgnify:CR=1 FL=1
MFSTLTLSRAARVRQQLLAYFKTITDREVVLTSANVADALLIVDAASRTTVSQLMAQMAQHGRKLVCTSGKKARYREYQYRGAKEYQYRGAKVAPITPIAPTPRVPSFGVTDSIYVRLEHIEFKLDQLLAMWRS